MLFGIIRALTAAIDAKDPYTSGHSERVARIAVRIAEELGMPANQRGDLYLMGLLHDVGKIGIDDDVLKKTGPLTPDEYRQDPGPCQDRREHPLRPQEAPPPPARRGRRTTRAYDGIGLSRRPRGRGDPAGGAHPRRGRLVRRDVEHAALPPPAHAR